MIRPAERIDDAPSSWRTRSVFHISVMVYREIHSGSVLLTSTTGSHSSGW